jgi:hypothetical protein
VRVQLHRVVAWAIFVLVVMLSAGLTARAENTLLHGDVAPLPAPSATPNCRYGGDQGDSGIFDECQRLEQIQAQKRAYEPALLAPVNSACGYAGLAGGDPCEAEQEAKATAQASCPGFDARLPLPDACPPATPTH